MRRAENVPRCCAIYFCACARVFVSIELCHCLLCSLSSALLSTLAHRLAARPRSLHGAEPAGEFRTSTRNRSATSATSQIRRQDAMGRGGGILRQTSQAVPPLLSTWSCVWGTNVLLSAMPVMIHAISVALVHWSPTSSRRNTLEVPQ